MKHLFAQVTAPAHDFNWIGWAFVATCVIFSIAGVVSAVRAERRRRRRASYFNPRQVRRIIERMDRDEPERATGVRW